MSVIFPPGILGAEMAAPLLRASGIFALSAGKPSRPIKIPRFRGGYFGRMGGGGRKCQFFCMGARILLTLTQNYAEDNSLRIMFRKF